jgi:hypothetical protein
MIRLTLKERDEIFDILPSTDKPLPESSPETIEARNVLASILTDAFLDNLHDSVMRRARNGDWAPLMRLHASGTATDEMRDMVSAILAKTARRSANRPPVKRYTEYRMIAKFVLQRLGEGGNLEAAKDAAQDKFEGISRKKVERACNSALTLEFLYEMADMLQLIYGRCCLRETRCAAKGRSTTRPPWYGASRKLRRSSALFST